MYCLSTFKKMTKTTEYRTKKKQALEATTEEVDQEIVEFLIRNSRLRRVKAQEILQDYIDDKTNTGERE
jgi:hypothetical protein